MGRPPACGNGRVRAAVGLLAARLEGIVLLLGCPAAPPSGFTCGRRDPSLGSTESRQGPIALPVATTSGTPASAAATTAASTPGVSCCCGLSSVPSTSDTISSIRCRPLANSSAAREAAGGGSRRRGWRCVPLTAPWSNGGSGRGGSRMVGQEQEARQRERFLAAEADGGGGALQLRCCDRSAGGSGIRCGSLTTPAELKARRPGACAAMAMINWEGQQGSTGPPRGC